jgi:hypothetical protein
MKANRHVSIPGLPPIVIESPRGTHHEGHKVFADYGYFPNFEGADHMPLDVFVGRYPSRKVFIVDSVNKKNVFQELKVFVNFASAREVERTFNETYKHDENHNIAGVTVMSPLTFSSWLRNGGGRHPVHPNTPRVSEAEQANAYAQGGAVYGAPVDHHANTMRENLKMFLPDADHSNLDHETWVKEIERAYGGAIAGSSRT